MRLSIDHRTTYRFSEPQVRVVQLLRMTPQNSYDQTVVSWHLSVDCNARTTRHRDGFGNATTMLYCEGAIDSIEIAVSGEVVTSHSSGVLRGASEPMPPALFLRDTPVTAPDAAIRAFAEAASAAADGSLAALHRLNRAVHERFTPIDTRPEAGLPATAAFTRATGTARDLAQIFIAAARATGVPARYVTGYCDLTGTSHPTPHAWAEGYVDRLGWVGFDPTLGLSPEEHHVRVAIALDAAGAAPVAGSRLGEGEEMLDVAVTVMRED